MCLREQNCHFHRSLSKTEMEVVAIGKTTVALLLNVINYFREQRQNTLKNVVASE